MKCSTRSGLRRLLKQQLRTVLSTPEADGNFFDSTYISTTSISSVPVNKVHQDHLGRWFVERLSISCLEKQGCSSLDLSCGEVWQAPMPILQFAVSLINPLRRPEVPL